MSADVTASRTLAGWVPIVGAFLIWFAHFLVIYGAALIWPDRQPAYFVGVIATIVALLALAVLFWKLWTADPTSHQTRFARRFGLGSIFIAVAGTVFDALPAFFG